MSVRGVSLRTVRWGGTLLPQAIERAMEWPAPTMTAASGGIRELLLGPRPAKRKRKRSGCWEPQLVLVSEEKAPRTPAPHSFTSVATPSITALEHFKRFSAFRVPSSPSGRSSAAQRVVTSSAPAGRASMISRASDRSSSGSSGRTKASTSGSRYAPGFGADRSLFSSSSMRSTDTQSRWAASCFAAASVASSITKPNRAAKR